MGRKHESPGAELLRSRERTRRLPFGNRVFSWFVGRKARTRARWRRRSWRSSLDTREWRFATVVPCGITWPRFMLWHSPTWASSPRGSRTTALAPAVRRIPVRLTVGYHTKARGTITAECRCAAVAAVTAPTDHAVTARLCDGDGDVVADVEAVWGLGPV